MKKCRVKLILFLFITGFVFSAFPVKALAASSSLTFLNNILNQADSAPGKSENRISSGRILLTDDPANYAVYEKLESEIRGLDAVIGNQADMISYYRFEDGILSGLIDTMQRIRELVLEKLDGILSDSDRQIIDSEIAQEYDQIIYDLKQAQFNTKKLFSALLDQDIIKNLFNSPEHYQLDKVDALLNFFIQQRTIVGVSMNSLEYQMSGEAINKENAAAMQSHGDTDIASESSALKRENLLLLVNVLMLRQSIIK